VSPDNALFPYYTDDKIIDMAGVSGSKTIMRVKHEGRIHLWEPFHPAYRGIYPCHGKLYKSREGNKIVFEETNEFLGLTFRYGYMFSEQYGIVKRSELISHRQDEVAVDVLDGIMNVLPYGVNSHLQGIRSTLVDAYKRNELDEETGLATYALSSMVVDKAEPSEALRCTSCWSAGLPDPTYLLSSLQVDAFRKGENVQQERDIKAEKGAFFVCASLVAMASTSQEWYTVAEVSQSHASIESLRTQLLHRKELIAAVKRDITADKDQLRRKIGMADGIQLSRDRASTGRHFSNVLFNIMRGGTFDDQYSIETADFARHVRGMNAKAFSEHKRMLGELPKELSFHQLRYFLTATGKRDFMRYYFEYLPLSFSRRHGDPSRPWNHFSIDVKDANGTRVRRFEGNLRDIFQNWEALAFSYPEFALSMISKFVNASTIDGYNPYRITSDGIDWEVIEPDDPWSFIGYWGDHQVIYLLKLLEISLRYHPRRLRALLGDSLFTYALVPYRIKGYDAIASDPKDTITFDHHLDESVRARSKEFGSDGKLVWDKHGAVMQVNLVEKLLVQALTKLYNFIPDAGIWLNTQRPEWNDANNALVGNGVSMVTLYYLRRALSFYTKLLRDLEVQSFEVNKAVVDLMEALQRGFEHYEPYLEGGFTPEVRRKFMDDFGIAGEHYRTTAYAGFTGERKVVTARDLLSFFDQANRYLEQTIHRNQRKDKLYHAYNLIHLTGGKAVVSELYEMLEGQVAVLSAGILDPEAALELLDALKASAMYRSDQYSYMLYPDRELLPFLKKNVIDDAWVQHSSLLRALEQRNDQQIVVRDDKGVLHFNGNFHNVKDLISALDNIDDRELHAMAMREKDHLIEVFERVFDHKSFTGRSGTFYGYEGLGSIYWHMVSKLLLAVQENIYYAYEKKTDAFVVGRLIEHYYEIRAGIGANKSPELYGAFPTDAYSHTPKGAGAQQPGMTGQVKEDIINRWTELGVHVNDACLGFDPVLLRRAEFLEESATLDYFDREGNMAKLEVSAGCLAFTYCQVPITYALADRHEARVDYADGSTRVFENAKLDQADSKDIFQRTGKVKSIWVGVCNTLT
jgi:hypothetical protein